MISPPSLARRSAVAGLIVWLLLLLTPSADSAHIELIHKAAFFAVLVIVPLGLSIVAGENSALYRLIVFAQPVAVVPTIVSFFFSMGPSSAALAGAWLIFTGLVALFGVSRLFSRGLFPIAELSIDAGLLYLPVGAAWLVIYRLGVQPFGYGETIILLTVVHFHFAGFAAPIVAGASGRALSDTEYPRTLFAVSVFGIVAAMPLVAAGITFAPLLGLVGALLLTTGLVLLAIITIGWVCRVVEPSSRALLVIGAVSSCVAMVLACLYAYSLVSKTLILTISTMAMTHGLLNAFGFAACSLIAWSRNRPYK